jgi:hypothetical protein
MKAKGSTLGKLFRAYDKAANDLIQIRDEEFPAGTKVRSRINPEFTDIVKDGSLHADQVNTSYGRMSWQYLEKVTDQGVE